jgi:hypothetical protein
MVELMFRNWFYEPSDNDLLDQTLHYFLHDSAYFLHQATAPQTLGYALHDSPTGLAAYLIEKYRKWSDCNGILENR